MVMVLVSVGGPIGPAAMLMRRMTNSKQLVERRSTEELSEHVLRIAECEREAEELEIIHTTATAAAAIVSSVSRALMVAIGSTIVDQTILAILIVDASFLFIGEYFVCFRNFLKPSVGLFWIVRIFVWMPSEGQFFVRLFYFSL